MSALIPAVTYPFDPTGKLLSNKVTGEQQVITAMNYRDYHFIVPKMAPYFADSLKVSYRSLTNETRYLVEGVDYYATNEFIAASRACATRIFGSISFLNLQLAGVVTLEYQTLGGIWNINDIKLAELLADRLHNPRTTSWDVIVDMPVTFPPIDHQWDLVDLVGAKEVVHSLDRIAVAIINKIPSGNGGSGPLPGAVVNSVNKFLAIDCTGLSRVDITVEQLNEYSTFSLIGEALPGNFTFNIPPVQCRFVVENNLYSRNFVKMAIGGVSDTRGLIPDQQDFYTSDGGQVYPTIYTPEPPSIYTAGPLVIDIKPGTPSYTLTETDIKHPLIVFTGEGNPDVLISEGMYGFGIIISNKLTTPGDIYFNKGVGGLVVKHEETIHVNYDGSWTRRTFPVPVLPTINPDVAIVDMSVLGGYQAYMTGIGYVPRTVKIIGLVSGVVQDTGIVMMYWVDGMTPFDCYFEFAIETTGPEVFLEILSQNNAVHIKLNVITRVVYDGTNLYLYEVYKPQPATVIKNSVNKILVIDATDISTYTVTPAQIDEYSTFKVNGFNSDAIFNLIVPKLQSRYAVENNLQTGSKVSVYTMIDTHSEELSQYEKLSITCDGIAVYRSYVDKTPPVDPHFAIIDVTDKIAYLLDDYESRAFAIRLIGAPTPGFLLTRKAIPGTVIIENATTMLAHWQETPLGITSSQGNNQLQIPLIGSKTMFTCDGTDIYESFSGAAPQP
jgi:hypothetical protein